MKNIRLIVLPKAGEYLEAQIREHFSNVELPTYSEMLEMGLNEKNAQEFSVNSISSLMEHPVYFPGFATLLRFPKGMEMVAIPLLMLTRNTSSGFWGEEIPSNILSQHIRDGLNDAQMECLGLYYLVSSFSESEVAIKEYKNWVLPEKYFADLPAEILEYLHDRHSELVNA